MPAKTISIADLFDETLVNIEGDEFRLRHPTRSVEEKHRAKLREVEAIDTDALQKEVGEDPVALEKRAAELNLEIYGDILDIWLEPLGEKKVHAKTVVKKAYKDDKIGIAFVEELASRIGEAGQRRPTSAPNGDASSTS